MIHRYSNKANKIADPRNRRPLILLQRVALNNSEFFYEDNSVPRPSIQKRNHYYGLLLLWIMDLLLCSYADLADALST